jgi:hypothetical protein
MWVENQFEDSKVLCIDQILGILGISQTLALGNKEGLIPFLFFLFLLFLYLASLHHLHGLYEAV